MKNGELIKKALEEEIPDMEAVQEKCLEILHSEKAGDERQGRRCSHPKRRVAISAGLGVCVLIFLCLCLCHSPVYSNAKPFIARLQAWLHLDHERVTVGEMQKNSIRIPEDCEEVEYQGEQYLAKSYDSIEELEEDIGKHLDVWRGVEKFGENDIMLRIVEGEYARIDIFYDVSEGAFKGRKECESKMQGLKCCITIPLSEEFSMNNIKLKDQVLRDAILEDEGNLIKYDRNGGYSIVETYDSVHLNTTISVIETKKTENINKKQDEVESYHYYYLYFVHGGLSYQISCKSDLETVKSIVEELQ